MHFATLLPTKQILINGGTNYKYYGSVLGPLLLTPIYDNITYKFTGKYTRRIVASAKWLRCYHSISVLLNDGKVLAGGGNCGPPGIYHFNESLSNIVNTSGYTSINKLQVSQNPNLVKLKHFISPPTVHTEYGWIDGFSNAPAELWQLEIYSPP